MLYKHILIDTSNLFYRAYSVSEKDSVQSVAGEKIYHKAIKIALRMIQKIEKNFMEEGGNLYFLFDNCTSIEGRRQDIDPEYKRNRKTQESAFYKTLDILHLLLMSYKDNYFMVRREGCEADDLVKPLLKTLDGKALLISNDMDWFRSISKDTHVAKYSGGDYKVITPEEFKNEFGFEPSEESICLYKTFRGDKSDNIPIGVENISEKVLLSIVKDFKEISEVKLHLDNISYISPYMKEKIKDRLPRLFLNQKLVRPRELNAEDVKENDVLQSHFAPSILRSLYSLLTVDIGKFDVRLLAFFPELRETETVESFFEFEQIPRA